MNTSRLVASALALSLLGCETSTGSDASVSTRDSGAQGNDVGVGHDAGLEHDGTVSYNREGDDVITDDRG